MSSAVPFATLMNSVRLRTNTENRKGLITDPEVREYLNEAGAEYWDLLVEARGQEHFRRSYNFTTVANQSAYSLPSDFYELISIDIQLVPLQFINAQPYMEEERNAFRLYPAYAFWYTSTPVYYRLQGSIAAANVAAVVEKTVNFIPGPLAGYGITLNYVYTFSRFDTGGANDANVIDSVNGWSDFMVWGAVLACKQKLKEDGSFAAERLERLRQRIQNMASQNDAGHAERVKDTSGDYEGGRSWWGS
jgi:hypothetical protein